MARTIWKGAITFGLVHVPIVVHPATQSSRLDFDWIDRRDNSPVGYQRINKRTGKPIDAEHIVKGYEYEKGDYVFLNDEDFRRANDAATQSIEILHFVDREDVPIYYFDTPYYLAPDRRGEKGYVLFREVLRKSGLLAIATVVLHTRQHLAALLPLGDVLMMVTMRYADEIRDASDLPVPAGKSGKEAPDTREMQMASRLVADMTQEWEPDAYRDEYREDLLATIEDKIKSGKTHTLEEPDAGRARKPAKVIDLMSMLQRSIEQRGDGAKPAPRKKTAAKSSSGKTKAAGAASRKTASGKSASKTAPRRRKSA